VLCLVGPTRPPTHRTWASLWRSVAVHDGPVVLLVGWESVGASGEDWGEGGFREALYRLAGRARRRPLRRWCLDLPRAAGPHTVAAACAVRAEVAEVRLGGWPHLRWLCAARPPLYPVARPQLEGEEGNHNQ
jgi:hypothetical protein